MRMNDPGETVLTDANTAPKEQCHTLSGTRDWIRTKSGKRRNGVPSWRADGATAAVFRRRESLR